MRGDVCLAFPLRQAFYDDRLEAFFSAHSAALGQAADALPAPVAITVAVAVDLGLAAAFAVDKLGGLALSLSFSPRRSRCARRRASQSAHEGLPP